MVLCKLPILTIEILSRDQSSLGAVMVCLSFAQHLNIRTEQCQGEVIGVANVERLWCLAIVLLPEQIGDLIFEFSNAGELGHQVRVYPLPEPIGHNALFTFNVM